ncbi:hypothetical protein [Myxococcus landrumensis]|uniref:Uncharacterized protein n=1 Tax=Myxococcus landrumensis TaxID=2813577 RepID=A0ABX7N147_9BACT|nr:hypothetical protein [Myxococcus landrumus]QSQ12435.1 hypothetical protein JY572_29315 [Myxococcus landrumus]
MIAPPSIHVVRWRLLQLLFGLLLLAVALTFLPSMSADASARDTLTAEQSVGPREESSRATETPRPGTAPTEKCPPDTLCLPMR